MKSLKEITTWMKTYSFEELLNFIQITSIHPSNQIFVKRFEFLLALLMSIRPEDFEEKPLKQNEFAEFINNYEKGFSDYFSWSEDWRTLNQLDLVPFFFEGKKYYFFYGDHSRPFEFLRNLKDLYISNSIETHQIEELSIFKSWFIKSLSFQTKLLSRLVKLKEAKIENTGIFIPSEDFFTQLSEEFSALKEASKTDINIKSINAGSLELSLTNTEELIEQLYSHTLFKSLIVKNPRNKSLYYLMPQLHINILYKFGDGLINSLDKDILSTVGENVSRNFLITCSRFFTERNAINQILQQGSKKNLAESVDFIANIDMDKILLFKIAECPLDSDLSSTIIKSTKEIKQVVSNIKKERIVGLYDNKKDIIGAPTKELELWSIVVFPNSTIHYSIDIEKKELVGNMWITNLMDIHCIFEEISSPLALVKFLKNDRELANNLNLISSDYIDRFAFYINNNESYLRSGRIPDGLTLAPNWWADYYLKKLFNKHKNNIYELIEQDYPNSFNKVVKRSNNVYFVYDSSVLNGGIVIRLQNNLIWIIFPLNGFSCTKEEILLSCEFLGPLYGDYINKLKDQVLQLFRQYHFSFQRKFTISLYPSSYIKRNKDLAHLQPYIEELNESEPLLVFAAYVKNTLNITVKVIFDVQLLFKLFESEDNIGERFCIKQFIKALILFFDNTQATNDAEIIADNFINEHIPIQKKGYTIENIPTINPRFYDYRKSQELSHTDIIKVNQKAAEMIFKNGIKPGEYSGEKAKLINNDIFQFLQHSLENEINKYNDSILFYAYREIEYIEAKRESNRIHHGMDASKYIEYDLLKRVKRSRYELAKLSSSAKYTIETILKTNPSGNKTINDEGWHIIQAYAVVLFETAVMSDSIHYDIVPHILKINESYEISDLKGEQVFNIDSFHQKEGEIDISASQNFYKHSKNLSRRPNFVDSHDQKSFPGLSKDFDFVFKEEYKFTFSNLVAVLYCLGSLNQFHENLFPLTIIKEDGLIEIIRSKIRHKLPKTEIKDILQFLSLGFDTFNRN